MLFSCYNVEVARITPPYLSYYSTVNLATLIREGANLGGTSTAQKNCKLIHSTRDIQKTPGTSLEVVSLAPENFPFVQRSHTNPRKTRINREGVTRPFNGGFPPGFQQTSSNSIAPTILANHVVEVTRLA